MKNVKLILPALAFLFAIVASFTSTLTAKEALTEVRVSLPVTIECADIGKCVVEGTTPCQTPAPDNTAVVQFFPSNETCGNAVNGRWVDED